MVSLKVKEVFCICYALLLFFSGIVLVGFSVVFCYRLFYHYKFIPSGSVGPFIVLFLLGCFHLILTWLAVKGPTRQQDCHLILFMFITFGLLLAECAVGVWSMILWDEIDLEVLIIMTESFKTVVKEDFNKNSEWNKLQSKLKCCGLNGIGDYKTTKGSFPVSCCEDQKGPNITCFQDSCRFPLARYVKNILLNGAILSFLSCFFQAVGVFLFYSFFRTLRRDRSEKRRLAIQKEMTENIPLGQVSHPPSAPPVYTAKEETTQQQSRKSSKRRSSKGSAPSAPIVQTSI